MKIGDLSKGRNFNYIQLHLYHFVAFCTAIHCNSAARPSGILEELDKDSAKRRFQRFKEHVDSKNPTTQTNRHVRHVNRSNTVPTPKLFQAASDVSQVPKSKVPVGTRERLPLSLRNSWLRDADFH